MLFSLLGGGSLQDIIIRLLLSLPMIMLALSAHEAAHGWVAYKCGDPTAYNMGRLTLNPAKHLDPIGFLSMLIFGYGWAKPVPVHTRNFKNPRRGMALTGAAGPAANLLLGVICAVLGAFFFSIYYCMLFSSISAASDAEPGLAAN
jgi:Zn-dependent protease